MKFLIDAHLPVALCEYFADYDCVHTSILEAGNLTKDSFINDLSIKEKRAVITKDTDFFYSFNTTGKPYKLVLVRLGNMRLTDLKNYFKKNSPKIIELLKNQSFIVLEINKIRIVS